MQIKNDITAVPNWLRTLWQQDEIIRELDPLKADELMSQLPLLNLQRDTEGLTQMLQKLLPSASQARSLGFEEACAAMRDLGLVMGSLKRHGVEPVARVPGLEEVLPLLATLTSLPPRDTLLHYTIWNPAGSRERRYKVGS